MYSIISLYIDCSGSSIFRETIRDCTFSRYTYFDFVCINFSVTALYFLSYFSRRIFVRIESFNYCYSVVENNQKIKWNG